MLAPRRVFGKIWGGQDETHHFAALLALSSAQAASPDIVAHSGVPCGVAAPITAAGVEVRHDASVDTVTKDGAKITSITLTDGTKLTAKVFVDASYEGDLMARADVKYAVGREPKAEFGEDAAGIRFDKTARKARAFVQQRQRETMAVVRKYVGA